MIEKQKIIMNVEETKNKAIAIKELNRLRKQLKFTQEIIKIKKIYSRKMKLILIA
jgi:hypothetical protein